MEVGFRIDVAYSRDQCFWIDELCSAGLKGLVAITHEWWAHILSNTDFIALFEWPQPHFSMQNAFTFSLGWGTIFGGGFFVKGIPLIF